MRLALWLSFLLLSSFAFGQGCTAYSVVSAFDHKTGDDITNLRPQDFEARMGSAVLPIVNAEQNFSNRVLVLLETDGRNKDDIEEIVSLATRLARETPEGKRLAFGIFAKRSLFTKGFATDLKQRSIAINGVIEDANTLGKPARLYDALHAALAVFGPHEPGDTVLLISDGYDDGSSHSGQSVEKEFLNTGTRLMVTFRQQPSAVMGNFLWKPPDLDRTLLERMSGRSGGTYTMFRAKSFTLPWRGYMLGVALPDTPAKARKWKLRLGEAAADAHRKTELYYAERLPGCAGTLASTR